MLVLHHELRSFAPKNAEMVGDVAAACFFHLQDQVMRQLLCIKINNEWLDFRAALTVVAAIALRKDCKSMTNFIKLPKHDEY